MFQVSEHLIEYVFYAQQLTNASSQSFFLNVYHKYTCCKHTHLLNKNIILQNAKRPTFLAIGIIFSVIWVLGVLQYVVWASLKGDRCISSDKAKQANTSNDKNLAVEEATAIDVKSVEQPN